MLALVACYTTRAQLHKLQTPNSELRTFGFIFIHTEITSNGQYVNLVQFLEMANTPGEQKPKRAGNKNRCKQIVFYNTHRLFHSESDEISFITEDCWRVTVFSSWIDSNGKTVLKYVAPFDAVSNILLLDHVYMFIALVITVVSCPCDFLPDPGISRAAHQTE